MAADLSTVEAVRVQPGMPAFIDHWGGPRALAARVRSVDPSGFTKLSALGVEEQRVRVLLDLTAPPPSGARSATTIASRFTSWPGSRTSVLRVPTAALFRRGDAWAAFFVDGGRAACAPLNLGEQSPDEARMPSPAPAPATALILRPGEALHDGARV